jgi:alkylmercury lyase
MIADVPAMLIGDRIAHRINLEYVRTDGLLYPLTQAATRHSVEVKGHVLHALCAIDALGVAAVYRTDITISSPPRECGATVHVGTAAEGTSLHSVVPRGAVVWYDFVYEGSAAASCCPAITFFRSGEHMH